MRDITIPGWTARHSLALARLCALRARKLQQHAEFWSIAARHDVGHVEYERDWVYDDTQDVARYTREGNAHKVDWHTNHAAYRAKFAIAHLRSLNMILARCARTTDDAWVERVITKLSCVK